MGIDVLMADSERERIRERTVRGKRSKVKAGRIYVNGMPPYGYKEKKEVIGEGEDIRIKRTLAVEPEEAEVVREIYEMYLSDSSVSCTTIAKHLTKKGITPPGHTRYISDSHQMHRGHIQQYIEYLNVKLTLVPGNTVRKEKMEPYR